MPPVKPYNALCINAKPAVTAYKVYCKNLQSHLQHNTKPVALPHNGRCNHTNGAVRTCKATCKKLQAILQGVTTLVVTVRLTDGGHPEIVWSKLGMDALEVFSKKGSLI